MCTESQSLAKAQAASTYITNEPSVEPWFKPQQQFLSLLFQSFPVGIRLVVCHFLSHTFLPNMLREQYVEHKIEYNHEYQYSRATMSRIT